jgi:hypothetical protein
VELDFACWPVCSRPPRRACGSMSILTMTAAPLVFAHACKMGLEGIVSKRRDSRYRSGRSSDRIKSEQDMSRQDALNFIIHGIVKSVLQADVTYWP